jgi:hypothetical protein
LNACNSRKMQGFASPIGERIDSAYRSDFKFGDAAPVIGLSDAIGAVQIVVVNAEHTASQRVVAGAISHFVRFDALIELLKSIGRKLSSDTADATQPI